MSAARFLCVDGMSGSGKSSTTYHLVQTLYAQGISARLIIEKEYKPFKTVIASWYAAGRPHFDRKWVHQIAQSRAETFARHFRDIKGIIVFDRYFYTSAAYQQESDISPEEIITVNRSAGAPNPDYPVILECPPELALQRVKARDYAFTYFEPTIEHFVASKNAFERIAKAHNISCIDTSVNTIDDVVTAISRTSGLCA